MSGAGLGAYEHHEHSNRLMQVMRDDGIYLVVDREGIILAQYAHHMQPLSFGDLWIRQMASRGLIKKVRRKNLDKGTSTQLIEAHFDPEDWNYVRTAAESESKTLVAHDPDYSTKVCRILRKRLSLTVGDAEHICALLGA